MKQVGANYIARTWELLLTRETDTFQTVTPSSYVVK